MPEFKQIKVPQVLYRNDTGSFDAATGTMRISISSDNPYKRYDYWNNEEYYEVLDHSPDGMDLTRVKNGAALLFNHNRDVLLGLLSDPTLQGGKCYVEAKVSMAEDVSSYRTKIEEGILKDTSVGYQITDDGECIGAQDGIPVYRFKFAVHEASLVTIPADITVGVGRQRDQKPEGKPREIRVRMQNPIDENNNPSHTANNPNTSMKRTSNLFREGDTGTNATTGTAATTQERTVDTIQVGNDAIAQFKAKQKRILDFTDGLKKEDAKAIAVRVSAKHIADDADFVKFHTEFLNEWAKSQEGTVETTGVSSTIGLSNKEKKRFRICELMLQQFESIRTKQDKISGFYREASDAVAKLNKKEPDGLWIPDDVTGSSLQEVHGIGSRRMAHESQLIERMGQTFARALTATNFTTGGALVGTELLAGSLIELLLNAIRFLDGVTYLGGLVGNIAIPRVTGPTANSYWLPEGGTVSGADMTFAQLALVPHRLAATMAYDKQLVAQASLSVEALVRDYIARIMAVEKNRAMINGSGTNGQPLGLLNIPGVQVLNFATSGSPTFAEIVKFETAIETANADIGPMSWLTSPPVKGNLKSTAVVLTGATTVASVPIWKDDEVNGYPATATQNVPNNLVIMGVGSEYVVADWAGIDMVVNPYSLDLSGQIRLTVQQWTDNSVRHELAFCVSGNAGA